MLFLVQTVVQLSFCMLILMWLFASFQIFNTGCMSSSQNFFECIIMKKVEEHCIRAASSATLSNLCRSLNDWLRAKSFADAIRLIPIYAVRKIVSAKTRL